MKKTIIIIVVALVVLIGISLLTFYIDTEYRILRGEKPIFAIQTIYEDDDDGTSFIYYGFGYRLEEYQSKLEGFLSGGTCAHLFGGMIHYDYFSK